MRRRWVILALGLPLYLLVLAVFGWAALVRLFSDDWGGFVNDFLATEQATWLWVLMLAGVVAGSQAVLLLPVFQFRRARNERGKSLALSAVVLALAAAAMVTGLACGLSELVGPWGTQPSPLGGTSQRDAGDQPWFGALFFSTLIISWIIFSAMLIRFVRRTQRPENGLGRIIGFILGGTVIEALVILPIDIMVRRRTDCYCNTGTFFALAFSITAVFWLTGPGLFIALTARNRRAWYESHCESCGYAKGPSPGERCPECGFEWRLRSLKDST